MGFGDIEVIGIFLVNMTNFDNKIDNVGSLPLLSIVDPGPNISTSENEIRSNTHGIHADKDGIQPNTKQIR